MKLFLVKEDKEHFTLIQNEQDARNYAGNSKFIWELDGVYPISMEIDGMDYTATNETAIECKVKYEKGKK